MRRIAAPAWAADHARGQVKLDGVSQQEFEALRQRRGEILALVDAEVERYVSDNTLDGDDSFPRRDRLTGEFYVGRESYSKLTDPPGIRISVFCRCLGRLGAGADGADDYLGLEVYLRCDQGTGVCSVLDTDESSI